MRIEASKTKNKHLYVFYIKDEDNEVWEYKLCIVQCNDNDKGVSEEDASSKQKLQGEREESTSVQKMSVKNLLTNQGVD